VRETVKSQQAEGSETIDPTGTFLLVVGRDAYAGFMYSQVNNGLASGFLHRSAIDPTVGLRFQF